jgi:hypothetical protein
MSSPAEITLKGFSVDGAPVRWAWARYRDVTVRALPGERRDDLLRRLVGAVHAQTGRVLAI